MTTRSDTAIDITDVAEIQSAASLRAASSLDICYTDEQIEAFLAHRDAVGWCDALLALPPIDACWALAGLLQTEQRQLWAYACARRAKDYADRAAAADRSAARYAADAAARSAARSAADAAVAAVAAHYAAVAAADADAESRTAIRHGVALLSRTPREG